MDEFTRDPIGKIGWECLESIDPSAAQKKKFGTLPQERTNFQKLFLFELLYTINVENIPKTELSFWWKIYADKCQKTKKT